LLYQEPLKVLDGDYYKNYEGIYINDSFPEKNSIVLKTNEEIFKIFETECNLFLFFEDFFI